MKKVLDITTWNRKDHFEFFSGFSEPFFGVTVHVDCTRLYQYAAESGISFFTAYLHCTLVAVNSIEPFRYRISNGTVNIFDRIDASPTLTRDDGTFCFSQIEYDPNIKIFAENVAREIARVKNTKSLFTREFDENIIHFSALPWLDFKSLSHARHYGIEDSCPKISFGKMTTSIDGSLTMPVSIHVHHGLMDGYHVGEFVDCLQKAMNLVNEQKI